MSIQAAILKTICYADVFDFPLKEQEIWEYLIKNSKLKTQKSKLSPQSGIPQAGQIKIQELIKTGKIEGKTGFYFEPRRAERVWLRRSKRAERVYFLKGREKIVELRKKREKESRKKLKVAKRITPFLKMIPFVKMAAVTGALGVGNAEKEDDIDFLVVSQRGKIWTVRFLVTILVEFISRRRRPGDKKIADKICLNMFLDEEHLAVPFRERDLFSAHEVVQLKALWDKDDTYQKFLWENRWVRKFLPNAITKLKTQNSKLKTTYKKEKKINYSITQLLNFFENALKRFQLWYMRNRRTTEVISDDIIRFHPKDARAWVLREYKRRLKSYNLLQ